MGTPVSTPWSLVTVGAGGAGGAGQAAISVPGTGEIRIPGFLRGVSGVLDVIRRWDEMSPFLFDLDPFSGEQVETPQLSRLLSYPSKILCSGPNFRDHLAEMGESSLGPAWTGYFFFKPPTTALVGPYDPIDVRATWRADRVDWEGELAVVIGQRCKDVAPEQAAACIAGYTVANDISWRGPHRRDTPAAPFVWDWVASKAPDASLPLGPGLVPAWLVPDTSDLAIRTCVNGVVKQDGSTADMVLGVDRLVSDASKLLTLEPGDVLLTGTPAGVGAGRGEFLSPGDVVEVEIPGIGRLRNDVRLRPAVTSDGEETPAR